MASTPRILIVDDDAIIVHVLSTMLQKKGYLVAGTATTGADAIMNAAELMPDMILMDINLVGTMDGMDAAHYIFQLFHFPIIFVTGISDEKRLERIRVSQPYGIIFKPFTYLDISMNVDLALHNHSARPRGTAEFPAGDPKKLMEMHEALLLLDRNGRIIFFNPFAAWLIDLPAGQILNRHWRDVLMLINDSTDEQLKDPVADAVTHGAGVYYDTNTAMVTTTCKRRNVKVAARPVLDSRGKLLTVQMSLKEKAPKV